MGGATLDSVQDGIQTLSNLSGVPPLKEDQLILSFIKDCFYTSKAHLETKFSTGKFNVKLVISMLA